jgi:hypothetical protein
MRIRKPGQWVLWCEFIAFGLIILMGWLDELAGLPHLVLGGPERASDWREVGVETAMVAIIGAAVMLLTRRLLLRLHYLERFLRVCAWCRKIGYEDRWMPVEDFFKQGFRIETTHGMCPECLKKLEEDTRQFRRQESAGPATAPGTP